MGRVGIGEELLEPALEAEAVVEDEVGAGGVTQVARGGFVTVDLGADLGDRLDPQVLPGDVAGHVREHGESGQYQGPVVVGTLRRGTARQDRRGRDDHHDFA